MNNNTQPKKKTGSAIAVAVLLAAMLFAGCTDSPDPQSTSGVDKASTKVQTGPDGLTAEQENIIQRLQMDNEPGSVKHLYVISAFSGQVIIYSTVDGKVTSSGKRLSPNTVSGTEGDGYSGFEIDIGQQMRTQEVLQDDGTYGSSAEYIYWFDVRGVYHQHYISGGQIVHVSSEPLAVKGIIINMEISGLQV